jgi:hypothetical protein
VTINFSDRIERASFDGTNREVIATVVHPFAITVHGHYIYWTDWTLRKFIRLFSKEKKTILSLSQVVFIVQKSTQVLIWLKCKMICLIVQWTYMLSLINDKNVHIHHVISVMVVVVISVKLQ